MIVTDTVSLVDGSVLVPCRYVTKGTVDLAVKSYQSGYAVLDVRTNVSYEGSVATLAVVVDWSHEKVYWLTGQAPHFLVWVLEGLNTAGNAATNSIGILSHQTIAHFGIRAQPEAIFARGANLLRTLWAVPKEVRARCAGIIRDKVHIAVIYAWWAEGVIHAIATVGNGDLTIYTYVAGRDYHWGVAAQAGHANRWWGWAQRSGWSIGLKACGTVSYCNTTGEADGQGLWEIESITDAAGAVGRVIAGLAVGKSTQARQTYGSTDQVVHLAFDTSVTIGAYHTIG